MKFYRQHLIASSTMWTQKSKIFKGDGSIFQEILTAQHLTLQYIMRPMMCLKLPNAVYFSTLITTRMFILYFLEYWPWYTEELAPF
jgi:hypothetical protein